MVVPVQSNVRYQTTELVRLAHTDRESHHADHTGQETAGECRKIGQAGQFIELFNGQKKEAVQQGLATTIDGIIVEICLAGDSIPPTNTGIRLGALRLK